jgi:hypothetical protein
MLRALASSFTFEPKLSRNGLVWTAIAVFSTYFCMYAYRKSISAATFDGLLAFGISFKSVAIISQVMGYMLSKLIGIKIIAEMDAAKRAHYILYLIGSAHASLLLLAVVPPPYSALTLFINGGCLGLIWGLVFGYIEGKKHTDILALILSVNFIFSSGLIKSIGQKILETGYISERYMPFSVGLLFTPLLFLSVWMLTKIPPPAAGEINSRGQRIRLDGKNRIKLLKTFLTGLTAIIIINLFLTALRDIKDNYSVEIIRAMLPYFEPSLFIKMEGIAALVVLIILILLSNYKDHFKSIHLHHLIILSGLLILLFSVYLLKTQLLHPVICLIIYTIGLYSCYNTIQCLFFDRFISAFKIKGNTGFFFYVMDSVGYAGSCFIIIGKELLKPQVNWLHYFLQISFAFGLGGIISTCISWFYFNRKYLQLKKTG